MVSGGLCAIQLRGPWLFKPCIHQLYILERLLMRNWHAVLTTPLSYRSRWTQSFGWQMSMLRRVLLLPIWLLRHRCCILWRSSWTRWWRKRIEFQKVQNFDWRRHESDLRDKTSFAGGGVLVGGAPAWSYNTHSLVAVEETARWQDDMMPVTSVPIFATGETPSTLRHIM